MKKTKKEEEKKKKKKPWGLIGALIGTSVVAAGGIGTTIYFATRKTAASTYTVTVKGIEGATISGGSTQTVLAGSLVGQLPTPFKSNQIFVNWLDSDKKVIDVNREINTDMEVYASWKDATEDAHTVTFDLDGGSLPGISGASIKVNDKTLVGKLPSPTKTDHIFDYWTKDGTKVPFTEPITSNITLKANYKAVKENITVSGGSRLLTFKSDANFHDTARWVLTDAEGNVRDADWTIKVGGSLLEGLTISGGVVNWNSVAKGSYTAVITATAKGEASVTASTEIGIEVTNPIYALTGGTTQSSALFGQGGSATNAWTLGKDGTTVTSGITWTVTKPDGSTDTTINAPGGKLTWTSATKKGNYDLKIHAIVGGTDVAQVAVGLIITENVYVLSGGSRGFTVKPSQTITDSATWTLTKDTASVTTPNLSITDYTGTSGTVSISGGKVTLTNIPAGTWTFNVAATDNGEIVAKQQVSVISTETYSIKYGDGTKGSSLTIKDNATAVDSNAFTLLNSGSTTLAATWELDKSSTSLTDAQLHWDTTDTNKLSYANVPTGTYNLTITAKISGEAKATIPFTLTSQDTKIALEITGEDTLNFDNGLTSTYKVNSTRAVKWAIKSWTPLYEGESPTINPVSPATGTSTVVTLKNTKEVPGGTLVITATDETSGQTVEKSITVNNPEVNSSKLWTYDDTNHWSSVDMTSACGSGNISITPAGGTATTIARASFNQQIVFGDEITAVPDGFLNGCTTFNHWVTFGSNSKCLIVGNDFLKGCTAYNNKPFEEYASGLVLPNTVQIIGDNFLRDCTSFVNSGFTDFDMPSSLTTIGDNFLFNCKSFRCSFTIANTVKSIGESFMYNCYAFGYTSGDYPIVTINTDAYNFKATAAIPLSFACDDYTQACYDKGINIAGTAATELKTNIFPAITSSTTGEICRKYYSA